MASDFDIHIGTRELWGGSKKPFGLNDGDIFQHVWLNGQTGVGKSALMRSMFAQTVANGHGCTLIDINGDLANEILEDIPLSRREDVVICDPSDAEHVLPINPFYQVPVDKRSTVASDFTEACRHIWADSWGERMDWILYNVVAAILHAPKQLRPTILSIPALLTVAALPTRHHQTRPRFGSRPLLRARIRPLQRRQTLRVHHADRKQDRKDHRQPVRAQRSSALPAVISVQERHQQPLNRHRSFAQRHDRFDTGQTSRLTHRLEHHQRRPRASLPRLRRSSSAFSLHR